MDNRTNSLIEIKTGASPVEADIAIVSIDSNGSIGQLNKYVLDSYEFQESILSKLDLNKGFDLFQLNGKSILFIVTVGRGLTINLLKQNLIQALQSYIQTFDNLNIWVPLMGTGSGKLPYDESYRIIVSVLNDISNLNYNLNVKFTIAIPKSLEGEKLYQQIKNLSIEHLPIVPFDGNLEQMSNINKEDSFSQISQRIIKEIKEKKVKFYLVGSNWDNQGDQSQRFYEEEIWENGYGKDKFGDRVNRVVEGDILLNKSTFAKHDGTNYLRLKGIAVVAKNPKNSSRVYCKWIIKNIKIDIVDLSYYRDTISEPSE